jgi:erythronate-4-phosphate dehydrogenase
VKNNIIFIDENIPLLDSALAQCGKIVKFNGRNLTNNDLTANNCNILFVRSTTKVDEHLLKGSNVKFVGTATSGTDHISIVYLRKKLIYFADAKGSNANSVAEYVVYSILKWAEINQTNLKNKTIGIIGFGCVGKLVAKYANYFQMKILVNDPPLFDSGFIFPDFTSYSELNELVSSSDIITIHVPYTGRGIYPTKNLIGELQISKFRNNSLLIHTSRGGVVDEKPLLKGLENKLFYAVIDTWENEPLINSHLAKNTILSTPHIAGYSFEGKIRGVLMMAQAFEQFTGIVPDYEKIFNSLSEYKPLILNEFNNEKNIFLSLGKSRNLENDYFNLKETLSLPEDERARQFDLLRKNYPIRHEIL